MEDRYLFRGKCKNSGKWLKGSLETGFGRWWIYSWYVKYYKPFLVDHATVGQCTGLKDKNGTLIFEGDITKDSLGRVYIVEWYKDGFWLNGGQKGARWELRQRHKHLEIIGNIHDDPELLEECNNG